MSYRVVLRRLFALFGPYRIRYVAGLCGMGLVSYAVNVGLAWTMAWFTRSLVARDASQLTLSVLSIVAVGVLSAVLIYTCCVALLTGAIRGEQGLRTALFRKILSMPYSEISARGSGDLLARSNADIAQTARLYRQTLQNASNFVFNGLFSAVTLLLLDFRAGLLALGCGGLMLLLTLPFVGPLERRSSVLQERQSGYIRLIGQLMRGASVVRHFRLADLMREKIETEVGLVRKAGVRLATTEAFQSSTDAVALAVNMALIAYGGFRSLEDIHYLPRLMALLQLGNGALALASHLTGLLGRLPVQLAAAKRALDVLDLPDEPARWPAPDAGATSPSPGLSGLRVESLSFGYGEKVVFSQVELSLQPGDRAALVGPSGAGKSTLLRAILGLYPPASGSIRVGEAEIFSTDLDEWRRKIAYVPQNPRLFAGTVYNNIVCGLPDPGAVAVERAARLARAHDFITELSDGYQTKLAEGAANLSSGQKQRIAIARAFLQDAPVLLLDEPTAALDNENERIVLEALTALAEGRVTLLVSHRESALEGTNVTLTLDDGRILEKRHIQAPR